MQRILKRTKSLEGVESPQPANTTPPKRILFISPQPFFSTRGTPINVRAMAEILTTDGYKILVLTLPFGQRVDALNIKRVWKLPFIKTPPIGPSFAKVFYGVLLFFAALKLSMFHAIDLIIGFEEGAMIGGLAGLLTSVPYVADVDSCMVSQLKSSRYRLLCCHRIFGAIERFFLVRARAAITVCQALTRSTRAKAPKLPIYQIEDFPMEEALVINSSKYEELKWRFSDKRILLYTGNLEAYQGTDLMLRAYARYLQSGDTDTLLLVVGGTEKSVARLKALAVEYGIEPRVIFEGPRPMCEMGAYMAVSEFLLSPRISGENVPLKLYTYLSAGKPLIATNILSHTQIVTNESAFLGNPTDEEYSAAIAEAVSSPTAKKKALAGLALVQSRYSREDFARRLSATFKDIFAADAAVVGSVLRQSR